VTYWLFSGDNYYPSGGVEDYREAFTGGEDDAIAWAEAHDADGDDWKQLVRIEGVPTLVAQWDREWVGLRGRGPWRRRDP
jgi:hypothetical protein